jgi:hypothetical protein
VYEVGDQVRGAKVLCKKCQKAFVAQPMNAGSGGKAQGSQFSTKPAAAPDTTGDKPWWLDQDKPTPAAEATGEKRSRIEPVKPAPAPKSKSALPWILAGLAVCVIGFFTLVAAAAGAWFFFARGTSKPETMTVAMPRVDAPAQVDDLPAKAEEVLPQKPPEPQEPPKKEEPPKDAPAPRGQLSAQILSNLKAATVFIKVDAGQLSGTGSGFVSKVDGDTAYIVTNHHVVNPEAKLLKPIRIQRGRTTTYDIRVIKIKANNAVVSAVFDSGTREEQTIRAEVLAADPSRDLAVLRVKGMTVRPRSIDLSQRAELVETMPIYILGFPFGEALAIKKGNPAITINKGAISSLRKNEFGAMKAVQIDGAINPGNSGGPVVDENGRLVGIAVATIQGAGIGLAIAPDELTDMFRGRVDGIDVKATKVEDKVAEFDVDMQLIDPMRQLKSAAVLYKAGAVIAPPLTPNADGTFQALQGAQRAELKIGGPREATGTIKVDRAGPTVRFIVLQSMYVNGAGKTIYSQVVTKSIQAGAVAVAPPDPPIRPERPVGVVPEAPTPPVTKPPVLGKDQIERPLPDTVANVAVGGGGRFLILHLPKQRKLAVFDANEGKIARYISVAEDDVHFAAGADKLMVVLGASKVLQRWSLKTFEREVAAPLPVDGVVKTVSMGHASNGPLLIHWGQGTSALDRSPTDFVDIRTMKLLTFDPGEGRARAHFFHCYRDQMHFRASADGRVFGVWCTSHTPQGLGSMVLAGNKVQTFYDHTSVGHIVPGPDGKVLYTAGGMYTSEVKALGAQKQSSGTKFVPALQGHYYLRISGGDDPRVRIGGDRKTSVSVHLAGDERPLAQLPDLGFAGGNDAWIKHDFTFDKRIFFIPDAKLVVTIPSSNDRLLLTRFDVDEALEKSDVDYLFVTSRPPATAVRGRAFDYQLTVKSKKGGVKYKIESGPTGMAVSKSGRVTWEVPRDFADGQCDVVLTVSDSADQEAFHTFKLMVED